MYDPYKNMLEESNDSKLNHIASRASLRRKMEALLLLECEDDIVEYFGLSERQLKEYKRIYFNVDELLKEGRAFVVEYLECRGDEELLKYYMYGSSYAKGKMGLISDIPKEEKKDLLSKVLSSTIIDTLDKDPEAIYSVKNIDKLFKVMEEKEENTVTSLDETLEHLKKKGLLDDDE